MQQILKFFIQNKVGILFLLLFSISIGLTIQSHSYHNSRWVSSTSAISSFFLGLKHDITSYFNLKQENENLLKQNTYLQQKLLSINDTTSNLLNKQKPTFSYISTHIISNSYNKKDNFVLIDKGENHGVKEGYGVSLPNGIMGVVEKTSKNYSRVISILNSNLSINTKILNTEHFGSLVWEQNSYNTMTLKDLPRSASFKKGDTIITGGNSLIFPKGIPVGVIESFTLDENSGYFNITISLFSDMTNLNQAYVILPEKINEAKQLIEEDE